MKKKVSLAISSPAACIPTVRTSDGLRDTLFEELDLLRSGVSNPLRALAAAKLASSIVSTVTLEVNLMKAELASGRALQEAKEGRTKPITLGRKLQHDCDAIKHSP